LRTLRGGDDDGDDDDAGVGRRLLTNELVSASLFETETRSFWTKMGRKGQMC